MENINIERTKTTPEVKLNSASKVLEISGESYPENSSKFFEPIVGWVKEYINSKPEFEFNFKLDYYNTSSSKAIYDILDILENYHKNSGVIKVNWLHEAGDEDIKESGEEFSEGLSLPFNIISY